MPAIQKYEVFTVQCKWLSEGKGGFVSLHDGKRFEDLVSEFCSANDLSPIGGAQTLAWGTTILVSQTLIDKGGGPVAVPSKKKK